MTTQPTRYYCPGCGEYHFHAKTDSDQIKCINCNHVHYKTAEPVAKDYKLAASGEKD